MRSGAIDTERWAQLSLLDQLGNIGSEVGRSMNARRAQQEDRFWSAVQRALDLFSATMSGEPKQGEYALKEVARAKEEFLRIATAEKFVEAEARSLEDYFMQLATAGRLRTLRGARLDIAPA
jgi:hypothetical protein